MGSGTWLLTSTGAAGYLSMFDMFHAWQEQAEKLKSGEITQEEYDQWRYNYPKNAK